MVPFLGDAKIESKNLISLYGNFGAFVMTVAGNIQKFLALIALFLIGLALRNQFKMK